MTQEEVAAVAGKPICVRCGSDQISKPGFCSFRWRRGRWVVERKSPELAESECFSCDACGQEMVGDTNPPFHLEPRDQQP